jgi:hypothetical protein
MHCEEEAAPEAGWPRLPHVPQDGMSDLMRQRPEMGPTGLRAADTEHLVLPVQIVQLQAADFPGP